MLTELLDVMKSVFLISLLLFGSSIVLYMAVAVFFAVLGNIRRQLSKPGDDEKPDYVKKWEEQQKKHRLN